jgi:ElaA protein
MKIHWRFLYFRQLTTDQLYDLAALREKIFVVEQNCPYLELDGLDRSAWHLLGYNAHEELIAYLRIVEPGAKYPEPAIGRVLIRREERRKGIGKALMAEGIRRAEKLYPESGIRISAQLRLEKFYRELGFAAVSAPYDEDGIPHVEMLRK